MASSSPLLSPVLLLLLFSFLADARYECSDVSSIVSEDLYNSMFLHKDDAACPAKGFYPYSAFITAARRFPKFGTTGDLDTRKREVAAFFGQISHATTGL